MERVSKGTASGMAGSMTAQPGVASTALRKAAPVRPDTIECAPRVATNLRANGGDRGTRGSCLTSDRAQKGSNFGQRLHAAVGALLQPAWRPVAAAPTAPERELWCDSVQKPDRYCAGCRGAMLHYPGPLLQSGL